MALMSELRAIMYHGLPRAPKMRPWLMLPPAFEGGEMVYRFYDLVEMKQVSVEKRGVVREKEAEVPHDESVVVGSSHGWLALFNKRTCELFLSNPLTRRHIKLPLIHKLPIPVQNLRMGVSCVEKVIISNSPDEQLCRAMMIYGPEKKLTYCSPGRCTSWSYPRDSRCEGLRFFNDFAYSSVVGLFFCSRRPNQFEALSVTWERMVEMEAGDPVAEEYKGHACFIYKYMVVAEYGSESDDVHLYDVTRYIDKITNKTVGFRVRQYDWEKKTWWDMSGFLDGFSFFVGDNHSFVSKDLERDSVYFIDGSGSDDVHVGRFDYLTEEISTCYEYDPSQFHKTQPGSISWFTPAPH